MFYEFYKSCLVKNCYAAEIKYWKYIWVIVLIEVDEKATIRNRYNRIPQPALDTKWERNGQ